MQRFVDKVERIKWNGMGGCRMSFSVIVLYFGGGGIGKIGPQSNHHRP